SGREPGVLGAALSHHGSFAGLIMDGQHVSPISIQAALNAKGIEHSVLVTDAMGHVGSDNLTQPYFDLSITRNGKQLTTPDGSLAGSCLTMHEAVLNTVQHCNVTMQEAIVMATQSPANWLGVADRGRIEVGQQANLIALTPSNTSHTWQISAHWIKGHNLHA
ncbi:amidohydrolase family protein, partial [Glaciecola sp. HTCC2999]|uniref:amidohydrolase family protein n=1 Tax=Glaciecola sp. HTCC2999 TaxID=455436 RepID=UPI0000E0FAC1